MILNLLTFIAFLTIDSVTMMGTAEISLEKNINEKKLQIEKENIFGIETSNLSPLWNIKTRAFVISKEKRLNSLPIIFVNLMTVLFYIIIVLIIYYSRKILLDIINGIPFSKLNFNRLRFIWISILVAAIISEFGEYLLQNFLIKENIIANGVKVTIKYYFDSIFNFNIAVVLFIFTEILRIGLKLKEENDLTV